MTPRVVRVESGRSSGAQLIECNLGAVLTELWSDFLKSSALVESRRNTFFFFLKSYLTFATQIFTLLLYTANFSQECELTAVACRDAHLDLI